MERICKNPKGYTCNQNQYYDNNKLAQAIFDRSVSILHLLISQLPVYRIYNKADVKDLFLLRLKSTCVSAVGKIYCNQLFSCSVACTIKREVSSETETTSAYAETLLLTVQRGDSQTPKPQHFTASYRNDFVNLDTKKNLDQRTLLKIISQ